MGQRTVVQAAAFPDADALKRALKQNLSHLAQLGTTWHNLASHWAWTALIGDVIDAWERLGKIWKGGSVLACSGKEAYDVSQFYWETGCCQRPGVCMKESLDLFSCQNILRLTVCQPLRQDCSLQLF